MEETLIKLVSQGTGLSEEKTKDILNQWIIDSGKSPQNLSSEDFREVLIDIMQNLFTEVADGENPFIQLSSSNAQR